MFTIKGLTEAINSLTELQKKAGSLQGEHHLPLTEVFIPEFLSSYTEFGSLDEMFQASGFKVENQEDFE